MEKFSQCNKLFYALCEEDMEKFLTCANPMVKTYDSGECIIAQGDILEHLLLITEGAVELYKEDYDGNRSLMGSLTDGDTYGEQTIFGDNNKNGFTLMAAKSAKVMYFPKNLFFRPCSKVCPAHQRLIQNILSLLANQAGLLEKKITYLTAKGLRRKISLYLLEQWEKQGKENPFAIPLSREELADYFDVQRPSLSREIVGMKSEGIISFQRNTFKILDMAKLKELAK